jgi:hypothetical protein
MPKPVTVSHPDCSTLIGILSQFTQNPGKVHWEALKRVIKYLGTMKELWLEFGGVDLKEPIGYCNSDWASQPNRHSISGYAFFIGNGTVTRSLKKQSLRALSSTKAEYIMQNHAAREGIWMRTFFAEINN